MSTAESQAASLRTGSEAVTEREWFNGRVAIVTGGGSGIGQAIARALSAAGASVAIGDVVAKSAEDTAQAISSTGARALAIKVDVSKEDQAAKLIADTKSRFGRLDFLVNCAGNVSHGTVLELSEADWRSLIDVHLTGTFLCTRAAFDAVYEKGGSVVSMSSSYAFKGRPGGAHYSAAKAGIFGFTRVLASELAPNATANCIAPGPIDTPRWRQGLSPEQYAAKKEQRTKQVPMGRMGRPEDIADAALFLLGPKARWMTGQVMHVNGGEFYP